MDRYTKYLNYLEKIKTKKVIFQSLSRASKGLLDR